MWLRGAVRLWDASLQYPVLVLWIHRLVRAFQGQGASGADQLRLEVNSQDCKKHHSAAPIANLGE